MTAALEVGEWSAARSDRTLHPGKTRYPLYRRLGGPQGRSGRAEKLVSTGIRSRTVQPVDQSLYRLSYPVHRLMHTFLYLHTLNLWAAFPYNGDPLTYYCNNNNNDAVPPNKCYYMLFNFIFICRQYVVACASYGSFATADCGEQLRYFLQLDSQEGWIT